MKILLVTPITLGSSDPHYYWFKALKKLGHQVRIFPLNHFPAIKLLKSFQLHWKILDFKPNQVFFSAGIDAINPISGTIFFCGVPPAWVSDSEKKTGLLAKLIVTNDDQHALSWQKLGAKKTINLPISGVDPIFFKPKTPKTIPVSFVGSLFENRQKQLVQLIKLYPELKIWGWQPPKTRLLPELKSGYQGEAWGAKLRGIYQRSLIGLNLAPTHMSQGGNIRTFEIPAGGALLLTDQLNPDWFIPGQEAVLFKDAKDCLKKINYFLLHQSERDQIAVKGFQRVKKDHTYQRHFQQLLKLL